MIIELTGWSVDREANVLSAMLREAGVVEQVTGSFIGSAFVAVDPITPSTADLIGSYFCPPTPEQIQSSIVTATQQRLDDFAKTRNYDGILSACTYAPSLIDRFRLDGIYCVGARDNTWAALYQFMAEVQAGTKPMPTGFADVEGSLPVLSWPV